MTTDTDTLVARLRAAYTLVADFPESKPDGFMNLLALRNLTPEVADRIEALEAEVERCHARLEITHVGQMKGDGTADLIRVEVPMAERATMPDGIDARDAAIGLLDEDIARLSASLVAEVTESEALRAQLTEARAGEDELARNLQSIITAYSEPDRRICCSGASEQCGCMGATVREEADHYAGAALASHDKRKEGR